MQKIALAAILALSFFSFSANSAKADPAPDPADAMALAKGQVLLDEASSVHGQVQAGVMTTLDGDSGQTTGGAVAARIDFPCGYRCSGVSNGNNGYFANTTTFRLDGNIGGTSNGTLTAGVSARERFIFRDLRTDKPTAGLEWTAYSINATPQTLKIAAAAGVGIPWVNSNGETTIRANLLQLLIDRGLSSQNGGLGFAPSVQALTEQKISDSVTLDGSLEGGILAGLSTGDSSQHSIGLYMGAKAGATVKLGEVLYVRPEASAEHYQYRLENNLTSVVADRNVNALTGGIAFGARF